MRSTVDVSPSAGPQGCGAPQRRAPEGVVVGGVVVVVVGSGGTGKVCVLRGLGGGEGEGGAMGADAAEPAEYAAAVAFFALAYVCGLAGFRAIGWPAKDVGEAASMIGGFVHCTGALGEGLRARACPMCAQQRERETETDRQTDRQTNRVSAPAKRADC